MTDIDTTVPATDAAFFAALLAADRAALEAVLTDDFVIVDVMSGGVTGRAGLVDAVASGTMVFTGIRPFPDETSVREYGEAAVVVGRTEMSGDFLGAEFTARSRYTHVFVRRAGAWRLASAQGTPITDAG